MRILLALAAAFALSTPAHAADPLMLRDYIAGLKPVAPDEKISYGPGPSQAVDVYLPKGRGPHPAVILVHGGCWSKQVTNTTLSPAADALRQRGVAVWNIEYRRADEAGGGYPGTYHDVSAAVDRLRAEARRMNIDLTRTIAVGHSSGAHLALWAAYRHKLPATSPLRVADPLPIPTVISLGGLGDLKGLADLLPWACGRDDKNFAAMIGEKSDARPDPFADTSPRALLPTGVRTVFLQGEFDDILPPFVGYFWRRQTARAGDPMAYRTLPNAGHFDVVAPQTETWPAVAAAIEAELKALPRR